MVLHTVCVVAKVVQNVPTCCPTRNLHSQLTATCAQLSWHPPLIADVVSLLMSHLGRRGKNQHAGIACNAVHQSNLDACQLVGSLRVSETVSRPLGTVWYCPTIWPSRSALLSRCVGLSWQLPANAPRDEFLDQQQVSGVPSVKPIQEQADRADGGHPVAGCLANAGAPCL